MIRSLIPYTPEECLRFIDVVINYLVSEHNYNICQNYTYEISNSLYNIICKFCSMGIDNEKFTEADLRILLNAGVIKESPEELRGVSKLISISDGSISIQYQHLIMPIYIHGCRGWCHVSFYKNGYTVSDSSNTITFSRNEKNNKNG